MENINKSNFDEKISEGVVVVDFFAMWCGPCRMITPILDKLAIEYENRVKFFKIDVDEEVELADKFHIMSVPTILIFKNSSLVETINGASPKDFFVEKINNYI